MKRTQNKSSKVSRRVIVLTVLIAIAVIVGGLLTYRTLNDNSPASSKKSSEGIDYSPATKEDQKESDQHKDSSADKENQEPPTGSTSVMPIIVDASQYSDQIEVRAYVSGIIEDNGTCTIKFTKGTLTVTKEVKGVADATTTRCTNLDVSRGEFSEAGEWTATVAYASSKANGNSQPKTFEVK